jgi:hypothetical protein
MALPRHAQPPRKPRLLTQHLLRIFLSHPVLPQYLSFHSGHLYNFFVFERKHPSSTSLYAAIIQCVYTAIFGTYCAHIFVKRKALVSSVVVHIYGNFMGYPEYFEIFKGHLEDERVRSNNNVI